MMLIIIQQILFMELFFSEEFKYAVTQGYKVGVLGCYKFKLGVNIFKDYVDKVYEWKRGL